MKNEQASLGERKQSMTISTAYLTVERRRRNKARSMKPETKRQDGSKQIKRMKVSYKKCCKCGHKTFFNYLDNATILFWIHILDISRVDKDDQ